MTRRTHKKPRHFEGLPLVDGIAPIQLTIERQDITHAKKQSPAQCAAARAIQRQYRTEARVFIGRIYIKQKKTWARYQTPSSIAREITAFDRGSAFEPGTFTVNPCPPSQALGASRGRSTATGTDKPMSEYHVTAHVRESARSSRRETKRPS